MIWIKLIKKLFKALNADASPSEIALGVVFGAIIGLTPAFALHNLVILALIIVVRVNVSAAVFSSILFGVIGFATDLLADIIGYELLTADGLNKLWTALYNMPAVPLSRFYNTIVLGSLLISFVLALPVYFLSKKFVVFYREKLQEKVQKLKIVKLLKASKIYNLYKRFDI
jgi:uncharacterized protein (TIGR03546 family)